MAEKRSLFQIIFGQRPKKQNTTVTQMQMLNGYVPVFSPWGKNPYDSDIVRSGVDAIAKNAAKLKPRHIRREGKNITPVSGQIEKKLQLRPNPNMSAYDFIYKMVTTLMLDNNAFAYPHWEGGTLVAIWPINCTFAEFLEDNTGTIYVRFYFGAGEQVVLPYSEVIHLRRHYYKNDMLGENNTPINSTLDVTHTTKEGLAQAVKTSAFLRGLLKFQGMLKPADIKSERDRFVAEYMTISNEGGIAALDSKADYVELKNDPKMVDDKQMRELRDTIYRYFGVNDSIVSGNYTEDEWNAFYESTIEPLAVQMSLEFTSKLFTKREKGFGNEIIFESNRLQYASAKTKVEIIKELAPMKLLSRNEAREILNLAPVEGGDEFILSLNYINADLADLYQVGKQEEEE